MHTATGYAAFFLAPVLLAGVLLWRFPRCRCIRWRQLILYLVLSSLLIWGALTFTAHLATARVPFREVPLVVWFAVTWRLAWELWRRTVGRWGQGWVRWRQSRRRRGLPSPILIRLIRPGRAILAALLFAPAMLSCVLTHRCKLTDGQDPYSVFGIRFESVRIPTSDGLTLDAWFVPDRDVGHTLIVCHGAGANKGNFVWFLGPLAHSGYNIVFFDFRAHGSSEGRTTTYGIRERLDVLAVIDWLKRERPEQARTIVGLGSSLGAMALALAAAEEPRIDAVVLDSPFVSPREFAHHHARRVPLLGPVMVDLILAAMSAQTATDFFSVSSEEAVASLGNRPVMVIHGDDDIMMPASHAQRLHDAARGPREIWFAPGPHSNIVTTVPAEYGRRVLGFLKSTGVANREAATQTEAGSSDG